MKRDFLTYPSDWTKTPRKMHDAARSGCAVEQFHKAQNRAIERAAGLSLAIAVAGGALVAFLR